MVPDEELAEQRAKVVAAGHATVSWVRARRATWTTDPLPRSVSLPPPVPAATAVAATEPSVVTPSVPVAERLAAVSTALRKPVDQARAVVNAEAAEKALRAPAEWARAAADSPIWSRAREATAESAGNLRDQLVKWLPRLIAALAIVGIGAAGMRFLPAVMKSISERAPAATTPTPEAAAAPRPTTGTLKIQSTPPGARVLLDGTARGVTPLSIEGVAPGKHLVALESNVGAVQRSVTVTAGVVAEVDESIFAGFLTVYSPFELSITEGSRAFRADERNEIMLPAGRHDLRLSNRALGFEEIRSVDLTPGQRLTISVTPPNSSVSVTANDAAEVFLDGSRLGDTPLNEVPVALGTHELVVRRYAGGERRFTVTITTKPYALFVDFSRTGP